MFDQVAMKNKVADEAVKESKPYLRKQISSLNLTPVQREEITKLKLSLQEEGVDLRTQLMKGEIELKKLWLEETPDRSKVYFLVGEMTSIRAEMQKKEINFLLRAKEILTPEQWRKLSREMFGSSLGMRHSVGPHR
ncbi:periplasmic heavy metal sensor [Patescibacteria group bacterium]|nr:periplasmic heavy metal sensor [Patescibacteria group bacterium]